MAFTQLRSKDQDLDHLHHRDHLHRLGFQVLDKDLEGLPPLVDIPVIIFLLMKFLITSI